jgi:cytidyltransferase-like protein
MQMSWSLSGANFYENNGIYITNPCPRVYVDGVYDIFHYGHAEMLGRVRAKFGVHATIIAGVARDDDCMKYKRPP